MSASRDRRRPLADELARRLADPEGLRQARLLQMAAVLERPPARPPRPEGEGPARGLPTRGPWPIGIWRPETVDGELAFVRPEAQVLGDNWPADRVLRPKQGTLPRRVCLLGESTAAGWFYAPHVTPARVLEDHLRAAAGAGQWEVVNLTRADLTVESLLELVPASLQLKPDVLVVFAGNNWPAALPDVTVADHHEAALALREAGPAGLPRLARTAASRLAAAALERIGAVARESRVPVVLVVPEVNLADWERARPVAWLKGDGSRSWHEWHEAARRSLEAGRHAETAEAARRMIERDEGSCAASQRLLGGALAAHGRADEAAAALRAESAARAWDNAPWLPGITPDVQEQLRAGAARHGLVALDLPEVFRSWQESPLSGRRLFLDYCHFTLEGMHVAMAAVTAEVLRISGGAGGGQDWRTLAARLPRPSAPAAVEARTRFMTGLYNGRWNTQPRGRASAAEHWLESALDASEKIREAMLDYVATRSAPSESLLFSAAQQRVWATADGLEHRVWNQPNLDPEGIESICAVLERRGSPVRPKVAEMLQEHHGLTAAPIDLLDTTYHWTVRDHYEMATAFTHPRCLFYRAAWPRSRFCFVTDGGSAAELHVTARLPGPARDGGLTVLVNGVQAAEVALGPRWRQATVRVPRERLRPGINEVALVWPPPADGDAALATALARLEQAVPADLHPVFGEVFRLSARATSG